MIKVLDVSLIPGDHGHTYLVYVGPPAPVEEGDAAPSGVLPSDEVLPYAHARALATWLDL